MAVLELKICTFNVRTLRNENKHVELEMELDSMSWDVVGLCETRMLGQRIIEKRNGNVLCYKGTVQGKYGVGILIHRRLKEYIDEFVFISDRVIGVKLQVGGKSLSIVQVYAPTMNSGDTDLNRFYNELNRARIQCKSDYQIFMGDFNALVRTHQYRTRNNRGMRLNEWIQEHQLVIGNILFQTQPEYYWTYHGPTYSQKDERDFIIGNKAEMFQDVSICRNLQFDSDHRLVSAKVAIADSYMTDFFSLWHKIEFISSANQNIFRKKYPQSLKMLKAERDELLRMENNTTADEKMRLNMLRKLFNAKIMKNISDYKDKTNDGYQWINQLQFDQAIVKRREDINIIATNYFQSFYASIFNGKDRTFCIPDVLGQEDKLPHFLVSEIHSISSRNNVARYHKTFNAILKYEKLPTRWKSWIIKLQCSHEDKERIENYKPVVSLTAMHRAFAQCLVNRLKAVWNHTMSPEQFGFHSDRSRLHILHTINQIIEKSREYQLQVYFAFVDFKESVNKVEHVAIWESLRNLGVGDSLLRLLKKMYRNNFGHIYTGEIGKEFKLDRGLIPGDPLALILLCSVIENIFHKLTWDQYGISINGLNLNSLRFQNKCLLIAKSSQDMHSMLHEFNDKCQSTGLSLNADNTKIMTNSKNKARIKNYEYISDCIFLDQVISFENGEEVEIDRRIRKTWEKYSQMEATLQAEEDITTRISLFKSKILPILVYGMETWNFLPRTIRKLHTVQIKLENKIFDQTSPINIVSYAKGLKWNWAGCVVRMDSNNWAKLITEWIPRDSPRKQGRSKKRWRDDFCKFDETWHQTAYDMNKWLSLGERFIQSDSTD